MLLQSFDAGLFGVAGLWELAIVVSVSPMRSPMKLLFNSTQAACEIAYMLRCSYDGCNGIEFPQNYDTFAIRTAIELTKAEFCFEGDSLLLDLPIFAEGIAPDVTEQLSDGLGSWCYISPF
jgi:hypothetical protein